MIKVSKDYSNIPSILSSPKVKEKIRQILADKKKRRTLAPIYKNVELRQRLTAIYHDKCAYCETKTNLFEENAVDLYRPRTIYYWLVYEWSNLLPCCPKCNSKKGIIFL